VTTCKQCRRSFSEEETRCPHCGQPNPKSVCLFQTSSVLISAGGSEQVFRSVEEVPVGLRGQLLRSTSGSNSATILIADQRGRQEIAKAMRDLPATTQRRLMRSLLGAHPSPRQPGWMTPARRRWIAGAVGLVALVVIILAFAHTW